MSSPVNFSASTANAEEDNDNADRLHCATQHHFRFDYILSRSLLLLPCLKAPYKILLR